MRVALVQAPVWWTLDPPLGLAQMAGCAMQYGYRVDVHDLNISLWKDAPAEDRDLWLWERFQHWNDPAWVRRFFLDRAADIERRVEEILSGDARAVCFSVSLGSQWATLEAARLIKSQDPSRIVVLGGQYFFRGNHAEEMLRDPSVDVVLQGPADHLFPRLLRILEAHGEPRPVPGLAFRRGGEIVDTGFAEPLASLDSVPFADFTRFPMELYEDQTRIPIAASRGCVWACRFCSTREFWPGYSHMGGDRIYAEVLYHRRLFPRRFHVEFYDITANGNPRALARFSDLVIENEDRTKFDLLKWKINAIIRPEMDEALLGKLARARCQDIIYGIESGSPDVLRRMNKHYRLDVAERVLADTRRAGIRTVGNFMFGFPGETEADFEKTLEFLRRNKDSLDRVYASATFTSLEEFSYLTEHPDEFGVKSAGGAPHHLYWETADGENTYPVRLERYRRFRALAAELGIDAYKGVGGDLERELAGRLEEYRRHAGVPAGAS